MQVEINHKSAELLNMDVRTSTGDLGVILSRNKRSGSVTSGVFGSDSGLSVDQINAFKESLLKVVVDNRHDFEALAEKAIKFVQAYDFHA